MSLRNKRLASVIILLITGIFFSDTIATETDTAHRLLQAGSILQTESPQAQLTHMATNEGSQYVEKWLTPFATTRIDLHADKRFSLKNSSADLLTGLWHSSHNSLFTQLGMRSTDDRFTTNIGLGHRHLHSDWLFGYNAFYDIDWSNSNQRWGVGLEAWRDYLKLSANGYRAISGWHSSRQHEDYDERPANGWDVRAEGWLPAWPQLGANLIYERYYGENVALTDFARKQRNPRAITTGVKYQPVPLFNFGVDYKSGTAGIHETRLNLSLNWQPGEPLHKQLDPQAMKARQMLGGSRLDLVNRNNTIVLDYRKRQVITLSLPAEIRADEYTTVSFAPSIRASHPVRQLEFNDAALLAAGGKIITSTPEQVTLQLPSFQQGQGLALTAVALDIRGNRSSPATIRLWPQNTLHLLSLTADKLTVANDGIDAATLTLHINNADGLPLINEEISLITDGGKLATQQGKTDENGDFHTTITSTLAGVFHVTAIDGEQRITHPGITFHSATKGLINVDKTTAIANGTDTIVTTLRLTDAAGKPLAGKNVIWSTSHGELSHRESVTQSNGSTTVTLRSTQPGNAVVEAQLEDERWASPTLAFNSDDWQLSLQPDRTNALANGVDIITFTLNIRREDGTIPEGENVNWSTSRGTLAGTTSVVDANGNARIALTSVKTGEARVSADIQGQQIQSEAVTFDEVTYYYLSMPATARPGERVTVQVSGAVDGENNILTGATVRWSTTEGGHLSYSSSLVDADGNATAEFSADTPGHYYVYSILRDTEMRVPIEIGY